MSKAPFYGSVLGQEDLEVGLIFTVHHWNDPPPPVFDPLDGDAVVYAVRMQHHPESRCYLQGLPLKIHRIELPYILALGPDTQLRIVDYREVELMKLSEDYWNDLAKVFTRNEAAHIDPLEPLPRDP